MTRINEAAQGFNERTIKTLSLPIRLRVIRRGQSNICLKKRKEFLPKVANKLRSIIRQKNSWHALIAKNSAKKNQSQISRRCRFVTRLDVHPFRQPVSKDNNGIESIFGCRKSTNNIESDHVKTAERRFRRMRYSTCIARVSLISLTMLTRFDICLNTFCHFRKIKA